MFVRSFRVSPRRTAPKVTAAFAIACALAPIPSSAAPGSLDPSFGVGGVRQVPFTGDLDWPAALASQSDQKFVLVGRCDVGPKKMIYVQRFLTDGTLDPTFGVGGRVYTDIGGTANFIAGIAVRGDGKIVVGGSTNGNIFLTRYNTDGSLDTSFGGDGLVVHGVPTGGYFETSGGLVVMVDNRVVVGGYLSSSSFAPAVARFLEDGSFDSAFGGDGFSAAGAPAGTTLDDPKALMLQPDGSTVQVGSIFTTTLRWGVYLVRFTSTGTLDTSFSGDGYAIATHPTQHLFGESEALQVSAVNPMKFVVAGYAGPDMAMVRFLAADGTLDSGFGVGGIATYSTGSGADYAHRVRIKYVGGEPSRIYLAGGRDTSDGEEIVVARFLLSGATDAGFDGDGVMEIPIASGAEVVEAMWPTNSGGFLLAARSNNSTNYNSTTIQVGSNGGLVSSWDADGIRTDDIGVPTSFARALARQPDGKILVGGTTPNDGMLARLLPSGTLDASFGGTGIVSNPALIDSRVETVLIQPDGNAICLAVDNVPPLQTCTLVRLQPNGTLDPTFGVGGVQTFALSVDFVVSDAALDSSGRTLGVGTADAGTESYIYLFRLLADGSFDSGFGDGSGGAPGTIIHQLGSTSNTGYAVNVQPDGKIVIAGATDQGLGIGRQMTIGRFLSNGFLDPSFDSDGYTFVNFTFPGTSVGSAIQLEPDGRIVVAGEGVLGSYFCVARLLSNGALDTSFDGDGMRVGFASGLAGEGNLSLTRRPNGGSLVSGTISVPTSQGFVCGINSDGSFASEYGLNGVAQIPGTGGVTFNQAEFDTNGRIVIVGSSGEVASAFRLLGEPPATGAGIPELAELGSTLGSLALSAPSPNPAREVVRFAVTSAESGPLDVRVLDVRGRLVRTLTQRSFDAGTHQMSWDLNDMKGRRALPGVYFLRAASDVESRSRKILVSE